MAGLSVSERAAMSPFDGQRNRFLRILIPVLVGAVLIAPPTCESPAVQAAERIKTEAQPDDIYSPGIRGMVISGPVSRTAGPAHAGRLRSGPEPLDVGDRGSTPQRMLPPDFKADFDRTKAFVILSSGIGVAILFVTAIWLTHAARSNALRFAQDVTVSLKEAEARFQSLVRTMPDSILIYDETGRVIFANEKARDLLRVKNDADLLGKRFESFVIADDHFDVTTCFKHVMKTGQPVGAAEHVRVALDGTRIPVESSAARIQWHGKPAFLAMLRDVSARYEVLAQVKRSKARATAILENVADGVVIIDEKGTIRTFNRAAEKMFGYAYEEVGGRSVACLTPDETAGQRQPLSDRHTYFPVGRIINRGQREIAARRKDGTIFLSETTTSEIVVDNERIFIWALRDISDRKHAEEERARLESELRHAHKMKSLGTLSGGIAHEFNNILLPIAGLLELSLREVTDRPDLQENLEIALGNVTRAATLVEKILSFSRIDNCELVRTNIASAIEETVALLQATIPSTVSISATLENIGEVYIDKAQISQIVMNLGVNAMHAIGTGVGRIAFSLRMETLKRSRMTTSGPLLPGKYARLSVTDTGCGMDEVTITRIFEPFYTTREVGEGTGMGLAFVHGVIENHGGAINVKSRPGEGTAFDVFVPFKHTMPSATCTSAAA